MDITPKNLCSFEELIAGIRASSVAAAGRMTRKQAKLKAGDCVMGFNGELVWFAELLETPSDYTPAHLRTMEAKGYRFARTFSECIDEDGELGDIHVSDALLKIDRETFDVMREQGIDATVNAKNDDPRAKKVLSPRIFLRAEALA